MEVEFSVISKRKAQYSYRRLSGIPELVPNCAVIVLIVRSVLVIVDAFPYILTAKL